MSIAYRRRLKTIRAAKRTQGGKTIPPKTFAYLQVRWDREVTGPPIGTLEDLHRQQCGVVNFEMNV